MKTFIQRLLTFGIPLGIVFLPVYLFLNLTGENYYSIDDVIRSDKRYLIGYAYNEGNYKYLKWKSIVEKDKQDIWALGSSRVLQLRADMFDRPFYNSGYTITSISDFVPYLKGIPKEKYPKTLIIGLDQWMFNENWDDLSHSKAREFWKNSFVYNPGSQTILSIYDDLSNDKYGISIALEDEENITKVGLNARVNNKGFRNDGSMFYGTQVAKLMTGDSTANDFNFSDTYNRIEKGIISFKHGDKINRKAFEELDAFLQFCFDNDIFVVGFIPPFANQVMQKMDEVGTFGYMDSVYDESVGYFKRKGFELWNLEDLNTYQSGDHEMVDGFHGGELTYQKMLIYMLKHGSKLNEYTNVKRLENDLTKAENRYIVYK